MKIQAWLDSFDLIRKELEMIVERDVLPATLPEFPTLWRMTLRVRNLLNLLARKVVKQRQREFTDDWDPLFIGYSAAAYFHSSEIKINSWTNAARKLRVSMQTKCDVCEAIRVLEKAGFENKDPIYDDGRVIVEEGLLSLKSASRCSPRTDVAPYGLKEVKLQYEGHRFVAANNHYVSVTKEKD